MCLVGPLLYYQCILMLWACERKVQSNRTDGLGVESCWPCAYQRGVVEVPNWNLKSSKLETRKQEYNTYIALTYAASAMATETTAALITFLHTITSMLTKSPSSCYRLIDFSKAFDTVRHVPSFINCQLSQYQMKFTIGFETFLIIISTVQNSEVSFLIS